VAVKNLQRNLNMLMALSLLALALFIGYWLKQTYLIEKEALVEKAYVMFNDSANKAEREFWHMAFVDMVDNVIEVENEFRSGPPAVFVALDSLVKNDNGSVQIEGVRRHKKRKARREEIRTLIFEYIEPERIHSAISDSLSVTAMDSGLELRPVFSDSTIVEAASWQADFIQLANGGFGTAQIIGGTGLVFRKMIPVILFSIGLFALSALAFVSFLRHLNKQRLLSNQQREFMYNMTHELKTPTTTIGLALEAIEGNNINDQKRMEYIGLAGQGVDRLKGMIDRVLQSSRLDKNEFLMNPQSMNPCDLSKEVVDSQQLTINGIDSKSLLNLTTDGQDVIILADQYHIGNALNNLVDNALKYGGNGVQVDVHCQVADSKVIWTVTDNGPGIAKEHVAKIFDKFYRVSQGKTHNIKGYGLGLHYALSVARQHGGNLTYITSPSSGSIFTMSIPIRSANG